MLELHRERVGEVVEHDVDAVGVPYEVIVQHVVTIPPRELPDRNIPHPRYRGLLNINTPGVVHIQALEAEGGE